MEFMELTPSYSYIEHDINLLYIITIVPVTTNLSSFLLHQTWFSEKVRRTKIAEIFLKINQEVKKKKSKEIHV